MPLNTENQTKSLKSIFLYNGEENNEHIFSIQDNGIGIDKQCLDKIFKILQRLHTIGEY
jgi:light-regulated signal transduction histidine kinase (bacteriophytochrome)